MSVRSGQAHASLAPIWVRAIEKHRAHQGWLLSMELSEIYVSSLSHYIASNTQQQITESQYARLVDEERAKLVPLADLAELLAEEHEEWAQADLKDSEVTDRAFARVRKEKKELLRKLFEEGTIVGQRKAKAIELNQGSFYDWLGEPVPIFPDWGLDYVIVPASKLMSLASARSASASRAAASKLMSLASARSASASWCRALRSRLFVITYSSRKSPCTDGLAGSKAGGMRRLVKKYILELLLSA